MTNDFGDLIKELRVRMEKAVAELKKFEERGSEDDASMAIWEAYYIWNGKEYGNLEKKLKEKGHKNSMTK